MALNRTVLMEDGSIRSYHEVERITHVCGETTVIDVLSWADDTKSGNSLRTFVSHDYDSRLDEDAAYAYFSALPEWGEYIDPSLEAIDALIPTLTDEQAELVPNVFDEWSSGIAYAVGDRVRYDGALYRCVQAHTSQRDWTPDVSLALWVRTSSEEVPEWVQPAGAHDAYNVGDRVRHAEKVWVSLIDANVYEPGVYGWEEV